MILACIHHSTCQSSLELPYSLPMKRVNIYLTEHEIAALQKLSQATGLKFAELVRRMIDEGVAARESKART
jgi:predicted DNA binding CopG/RHH family protein